MQAYVVFSGGGVKAAALVGAYESLLENQITPVGYGGTSAGAILATLAAANCAPETIIEQIVNQPFKHFLEDDGGRIFEFRDWLEKVHAFTQRDMWWGKRVWQAKGLWDDAQPFVNSIKKDNGIDKGDRFRQRMMDLLREPLGLDAGDSDIKLGQFYKLTQKPLRIVASDITTGRARVFRSDEPADADVSLIEAVRASMSYPIFFTPVVRENRRLLDGGLCSNLPSFLFEDLRQDSKRKYVIACNLVNERDGLVHPSEPMDPMELVRKMVSTALDGSDHLLTNMVSNLHLVDIEVPNTIDAMSFDLADHQRTALYQTGKLAFDKYFKAELNPDRVSKQKALEALEEKRPDIDERERDTVFALQKLYNVSTDQMEPILQAIARWIESDMASDNVRVHIMLPTDRNTRIVVYQHGMTGRPDETLELGFYSGCSGYALKERRPVVTNLAADREDPEPWGMNAAQAARVPDDRKAMISVPLWLPEENKQPNDEDFTSTISIDTSTDLADVEWGEYDADRDVFQPTPEFTGRIKRWIGTILHLLD